MSAQKKHLCCWHQLGSFLTVLGPVCMTCCASKSYLLSAQPVSTPNAGAWDGVKPCLPLKYYPKKAFSVTIFRWRMLNFPCQSKQCWNKSPRIPFDPKHFQDLIVSLNIAAWSKWQPSHKDLIHTEPDHRSCCALMCSCASSARETFSTMPGGAWVPSEMFVSQTES